jgi:hypothetical protein
MVCHNRMTAGRLGLVAVAARHRLSGLKHILSHASLHNFFRPISGVAARSA